MRYGCVCMYACMMLGVEVHMYEYLELVKGFNNGAVVCRHMHVNVMQCV